MGAEVVCTARWDGRESVGKAQLETNEIVFRGEFRLKVPLGEIASLEAADGRLVVTYSGGVASFDLGPRAEQWAHRIRNPRGLLDKLGVKPEHRVSVVDVRDEDFRRQIGERAADVSDGPPRAGSDLIFLGVETKDDLGRIAATRSCLKQTGALWVVSPKGVAHIKDTDVMAAGIAARLVDVKVAAFSRTHTATKLVIPRAARTAD